MGLLENAAALATVTTLAVAPAAIAAEPAERSPLSVYEISPVVDGVITVVSALGGAAPYVWAEAIIDERCPCDRAEVNDLDRPTIGNDNQTIMTAATISVSLALAAPIVADYFLVKDRWVWLEDFVVMAQAVAINTALTTAVKFGVQRPQPNVYDPGGPVVVQNSENYLSFYSGHTSVAFAGLSTAAFTAGQRYGRWVLPYLVTAVAGAGVGLQTIFAGRHFPSDVIVGALAGTLVGTVVPWLHLRSDRRLSLAPWGASGSAGIAIRGRH